MSAQVIDGRACARALRQDLAAEVAQLREDGSVVGLAAVVVGAEHGSLAYERRVRRLAEELGVPYRACRLAADAAQARIVDAIRELDTAPWVSGILVLRPLPAHVDETAVFRAIDPRKDVEAVHPENAGLLALGVPRFVPSTAASAFHLLDTWLDSVGEDRADFYHRSLVVVVGRSNGVGKPALSLAYQRQAAVESIDERTGLGRYTRWADVLIVAAGKPGLIKAEHVNENAIVIDVGINPRTGPDGRVRMVGDVEHEAVAARVRAIAPIPGGVGPVTGVGLLRNTLLAARLPTGSTSSALDDPRRTLLGSL